MSSVSNSSTVSEEEWSAAGVATACVILAVCFLVGAPGNMLVVWTIVRHLKQRSHIVLLILHLAVADLLVLITLPLWIYSLAWSWVFGEAACKVMVYIIYSCMYSSVFLITIMSVERFLAIRYPFKMLHWKNNNAMKLVLVGVWCLALLLGIPVILTQTINERMDGMYDCFYSDFGSVPLEVFCACLETLVGFIIPFLTLTICYFLVASRLRQMHRTNQKSGFLISGVMVAFALCWVPHHIFNIITVARLLMDDSDKLPMLSEASVFISGALTFISSSVNPILYAFAARNIQGGLRKSAMVKLFQEVTLHTQLRGTTPQVSDCSNKDQLEQISENV
ncbi:leukotriene B4 receptor 1 [Trichomycterus rosablanca]|uniref:leukotriene B4 receptor 1 n=1 Tax=Trichomycterus rosablanca TaxID=2290929 RepID=UPI002F3601A1